MKRTVQNGIDNLHQILPSLQGARVGLITNPTGVDKALRSTIDILHRAGVLSCLFSPEHGVRGDLQAGARVETYTDAATGLPVYSTYGGNVHIPKEILDNLDVVAFDIQDVGARYYTYMYTLSYAMEDCAAAGKRMLVFDRVNPVGGVRPEGTVLEREYSSFVGRYPLASRHNLTMGEYARYINNTEHIGCDLTVVPITGWNRDCYFDETDLIWIQPSPNIPTVDSAFAYLCTCLAEGTNLSEGRGTTRPFEQIGAPWLNAQRVADAMNEQKLPGVLFRPCCFTPVFSKHANQMCRGIMVHVTDRRAAKPFETGMRLFDCIKNTHAEFSFLAPYKEGAHAFVDLLLGTDAFRKDDFELETFLKEQREKVAAYEKKIKPYYLY